MTISSFLNAFKTDGTALIITEREKGRVYDGTVHSFKRDEDDPFTLEIKGKLMNRKIFQISFDIVVTNPSCGLRMTPTITIVI